MGCGSSVSRPPEATASKNSQTSKPTPQASTTDQNGGGAPAAQPERPATPEKPGAQQSDAGAAAPSSRPGSAAVKSSPPSASASGRTGPAGVASGPLDENDPQGDTRRRAEELTRILGKMKSEHELKAGESKKKTAGGGEGGEDDEEGGGGGFGAEIEALLGGLDTFPDLLKELMEAPTQVLLPGNVDPKDAAALQAVAGCSTDQATRLLDCLGVVLAAAEALGPEGSDAPAAPAAASTAAEGGAAGEAPAKKDGQAAAGPAAGTDAPAPGPTPQQLARVLGTMSGLVSDVPGLRTAAMARGAPDALLRILLRHTERAAAANAALVLSALAAGPPPHKTALISAGAVQALLRAVRGDTAAAAAANGDAPGVSANACSALGNLVTNHAAGAAAVAAGGGLATLLAMVDVDNAANVRTNAAGVLVQLTATHESYRAAVVAAGGVPALAAGMLRGPDAPACNAVTALYNLAALTPPALRPAMARATGPLAVVPLLLLCMAGRNKTGAADESVAAASSARVNASAVLLELCKDPASAPLVANERQGVPAALASLAAGRLPPPPPQAAAAAAADFLTGGVELLYPVPPVVRGNALMGLMALARMGPSVQLELGRCGALGTLMELLAPGQDSAMQVNSANAICSLATANGDILEALVAARCVPIMAALLLRGGDAARANVCAVFVNMMGHDLARQQLQECGGLTAMVRLTAAVLDERAAEAAGSQAEAPGGGTDGPPVDTGGVLCNSVGALAEASKYPELRRALMQVEFGESLSALLRCLQEKSTPEPAQVNAAAALCHLCREQQAAVQLGRMRGVEILKAVVEAGESGAVGRPSARLVHNASRALERLQYQVAEAEAEAERAAAAAAPAGKAGSRPSSAAAASSCSRPVSAAGSTSGDKGGPRAVWGVEAGGSGRARDRPAGGVTSFPFEDDDVDDISTVIKPPTPLAAF